MSGNPGVPRLSQPERPNVQEGASRDRQPTAALPIQEWIEARNDFA
jgi:hypothetical protein